jgi:hypothetical protein
MDDTEQAGSMTKKEEDSLSIADSVKLNKTLV